MSAAGQVEWHRTVTGVAGAEITDAREVSNELWLTGTATGLGSPTDLFFAKLDRAGDLLSALVVETVGEEQFPRIATTDESPTILVATDSFGTRLPGDRDLWWLSVGPAQELESLALFGSRDAEQTLAHQI